MYENCNTMQNSVRILQTIRDFEFLQYTTVVIESGGKQLNPLGCFCIWLHTFITFHYPPTKQMQ